MTGRTILPIDPHLDGVVAAVRSHHAVVLIAEPGSGKTTRVPPALLDAKCFGEQRIIVLQPRRVAARTTAARIAYERAVRLGAEIGYRIRFENRTTRATRLEIVTEGLLLRQLQQDPLLEDVGCIIFDEFHERSLNTDLAVAMVREIQSSVRPDLRIIIMSATLDPDPLRRWLDAHVIRIEGRTYPVAIEHAATSTRGQVVPAVISAIHRVRQRVDRGHILVFLPGVGEIERTRDSLGECPGFTVIPLHGRLPTKAQDHAFSETSQRKLILATNIAETSVTIEGVTAVIDAGLAREPVYDRAIGMERLETVRISRHSADQRAGRAGRRPRC